MKILLWIILVVLNILLVLAVIDAIRYTIGRRRLRNMLSFKHKLVTHMAMCGGENDHYSVYNDEKHIKQLQLTIYESRHHGRKMYRVVVLCPYHNYYESFDVTKSEFDSIKGLIPGREEKKS